VPAVVLLHVAAADPEHFLPRESHESEQPLFAFACLTAMEASSIL
jgi:hypothetical protein